MHNIVDVLNVVDLVDIALIENIKMWWILSNMAVYMEMGIPVRTRGGVPRTWDAILEHMGDIVDIANISNIVDILDIVQVVNIILGR